MTRRGQIEYSMRRYGVPLCVEGTQGVGFLRALNTKSGQEPEEYWCAVQAGLGLREGALVECRGRRYQVVRCERMWMGREELYDWAILHRTEGALNREGII